MNLIDFDTLDARIEAERSRSATVLRELADVLDRLPFPVAIDALGALAGPIEDLWRHAGPWLTTTALSPSRE